MTSKSSDSKRIRQLAELLDETNLSEIEIESDGTRIRVARQVTGGAPIVSAPAPVAAAAPPSAPAEADTTDLSDHPGAVTSPMVGTAYLAPEPGAAPFVKAGDSVSEGQTILIVEAMKTMNPITAPKSGTIKQVCVGNAQPVEFGEVLVIID
ncbi:MAG: acetyl-CoA carboxylase biotin carboxyl carrier protein [Parvibaculales bacterium]